ncbi:MAG: HesA/MoeB/ThiF family protein [Deltaproteobacteria bacterium]|jgi:adenylyltransferase/sulfurtransferase|nr:HesA/MoeB/ThiF family protein [Deltaproteobacteria bacterium]MBW1874715.1 HesA/MoeB/ThiF family protein [Deltaproteobacteria bacterium]MBW2210521.1 HesA/MoeB/ThiF family protein [Deltaproteobacteria bacterium]MBW2214474.1 HesA/MoeB/ThiF family protein [Deltaproteobacteria bacterium]MBW2378754.1 HesA/MoeB/ThiF family protein [Deltaproteobacteria bacterium]
MSVAHRVLVVGAGGLGSPVLRLLAPSGVEHITIVDDDVVDESNLHRQTLYKDRDVGQSKIEQAVRVLRELSPKLSVRAVEGRFVPGTAMDLLSEHTLVVEGADNLATKFLVADAARLAGVPAVQAGAVRWAGWAFCALPDSACLRCLFEDIPRDRVDTCAEAGVVGPVVGVLGGLEAALVCRLLQGERPGGELWHYDALKGALRKTFVRRRSDCPLCAGEIQDLRMERYTAACAA